jgi:cytochrome b involved in lipid metabolism
MEYYKQDTVNNQVVLFEGVVYNVGEYKDVHPGGSNYLEDNLGKNIDELFKEFEHTKSAKAIFKDLPIVGILSSQSSTDDDQTDSNSTKGLLGIEIKSKFVFDYNKPLVP